MKKFYRINGNNFFIGTIDLSLEKKVIKNINEGEIEIIETDQLVYVDVYGNEVNVDNTFIEIPVTQGFYKAKWTGSKWIEGATLEEIQEIQNVNPSPPITEVLGKRIVELELQIMTLGGM